MICIKKINEGRIAEANGEIKMKKKTFYEDFYKSKKGQSFDWPSYLLTH